MAKATVVKKPTTKTAAKKAPAKKTVVKKATPIKARASSLVVDVSDKPSKAKKAAKVPAKKVAAKKAVKKAVAKKAAPKVAKKVIKTRADLAAVTKAKPAKKANRITLPNFPAPLI